MRPTIVMLSAIIVMMLTISTISTALSFVEGGSVEEGRIETGDASEGTSLPYPALDISTGAVKARPSDMYNDVWEDLGYTGKGINIAIIDTGVDDGHETFEGRWVAGVDIIDPTDPRDGTNNPDDRNGHGTRVGSCLVGNGGPGGQYRGIAPEAGLVEIKVANDLLGGFSTNEYLMDGINWAVDHMNDDWGDSDPSNDGIDVLSISYANQDSDDGSSDLAQTVDDAVRAGLIVIVAIGNDGPDNDGFGPPSSSDLAITVGGIDDRNTVDRSDDIAWDEATQGPRADDGDNDPYDELKPEIVAPAVGITAAQFSLTDQNGEGWDTQDGTSYSTPHCSGTAALMLEANPELTQEDIDRIMRETAEPRGEPDFPDLSDVYNVSYGFGILDAYACVSEAERLAGGTGMGKEKVSCSIGSPIEGEIISGTVNITGTAWCDDPDEDDVDRVQVRLDGHTWLTANGTDSWWYIWNTTSLDNGEYFVSAKAISGLDESVIIGVNVTISNPGGNGTGGGGVKSSGDDDDSFIPIPALPMVMCAFGLAAGLTRRRDRLNECTLEA